MDEGTEFGPRRGRQVRIALVCLALGSVTLAPQAARLGHAAGTQAASLPALAAGGLLLAFGLATLLALALGRPRLVADRHGLALHGLLRTTRARWDGIGGFALVPVTNGRLGGKRFMAVAPRLGPGRTRRFMVPDSFAVPLPRLLDELGALRPGAPVAPAEAAPPRPCGVPGFRWPWLTAAMLAVQVGVFALERHVSAGLGAPGDPSLQTLVALGGVSRDLVASGEWFRLLTAPLLHASATHLITNALAFALAGYALERLVGGPGCSASSPSAPWAARSPRSR